MSTDSERLRRAAAMWQYVGDVRPPFAVPPGPGEESVWDYPRPPRVAAEARELVVRLGADEIARTRRGLRVLETASPPTFYFPAGDVNMAMLSPASGSSTCEWKGTARYWTVTAGGRRLEGAAWSYAEPYAEYAALRGCFGFYPTVLECLVDGVRVRPQPGRFYAGWITPELVGPFKGEPGSGGW
jgi:uncharacterized protein (DUF427 family)